MAENSAPTTQSASFPAFGAAGSRADIAPEADSLPKPSAKHTIFTCTLLLGYVAGYATIGYTMVVVAVRLWSAIFR